MGKPFGKSGGKSFGGGRSPSRGYGGTDTFRGPKPMTFKATCAECGDSCEVPFRPNGKKPVLCSRCFKRDEAPRFASKPWEKKSFSPGAGRGSSDDSVQAQLRDMNAKLEQILSLLQEWGD